MESKVVVRELMNRDSVTWFERGRSSLNNSEFGGCVRGN